MRMIIFMRKPCVGCIQNVAESLAIQEGAKIQTSAQLRALRDLPTPIVNRAILEMTINTFLFLTLFTITTISFAEIKSTNLCLSACSEVEELDSLFHTDSSNENLTGSTFVRFPNLYEQLLRFRSETKNILIAGIGMTEIHIPNIQVSISVFPQLAELRRILPCASFTIIDIKKK